MCLGVEPIEINSALVSAQNRKRLYWTNIPGIKQPKDKGILLESVLESTEYKNPSAIRGKKEKTDGHYVQYLDVKQDVTKSNCLTTVSKVNTLTCLPPGAYANAYTEHLPFRYYSARECCRLQTLPDDYTNGLSDNQARKCLGNGWTVDVIAHILSYLKF